MSHSKRNTSLAFFTSYERSLLKSTWGSRSTRIGRDTFLPFGSCNLCLLPTRDPVACPQGDLFCRECAMSNLLAQHKEIKRLEKEMKKKEREIEEEDARMDEEAKRRGVEEFERVQMGFNASRARDGVNLGTEDRSNGNDATKKGAKRKFEIDEDELLRIAQQDRAKARRAIEEEQAAKQHLPSFWVASETPDEGAKGLQKSAKMPKLQPVCPSSDESKPHYYSLKTLTTVNFSEEKSNAARDPVRSCPACRKALSNATKAMLAVPCGHVLCKPCVNKFLTPHQKADAHDPDAEFGVLRCYVCDEDLSGRRGKDKVSEKDEKEKKKDRGLKSGLTEIKSDGTGFAGGGKNMARKEGVAFQC